MSHPLTDAVFAEAMQRMEAAAGQHAAGLRDQMKELISVPVVRTGSRVIRSRPGEPPRKDSGKYQNSMSHEVIVGDLTITANVGSNVNYGPFLQYGTSRMKPRPHFDKIRDAAEAEAAGLIQSYL